MKKHRHWVIVQNDEKISPQHRSFCCTSQTALHQELAVYGFDHDVFAGNLAHMLNHSCEPNCYSRTIEVLNKAGQQEEHVVIIAKQAIGECQELTYDYRFSSSEVLPCNCGAKNCCGLVNASGVADGAWYRVPLDQLKPLKLKAFNRQAQS